MDSGDALQLIALVILLVLSAYFSSSETALIGVSSIRIRSLAEEGNKRAVLVSKLQDNQQKMLSAILIGNNIVNLSASSLSTMLATKAAMQVNVGVNTATMVGIATGVLTLLILIFGEITPKNAATINAEKMALSRAPVIYALTKILTPVIFVVNALSSGLMRLMGIRSEDGRRKMTESDFMTVVDVGHEQGVIESDEKELITNVVDFGDSVASDVMVPRIDVTFLDVDASYEETVYLFRDEKYSRIPVYEEDKDHIIGILNLKDLFCYTGKPEDFDMRLLLREPHFTYEFRKTSDLMASMRRDSINIVIVLDEYGAVAGILTLEDLLEEIVGEIRDEYDAEEMDDIREISPTSFLLDGNTKLEDVNDRFGLELDSEDYDSIAGHVMHELGHIPAEGDMVMIGDIQLTVKKMDRNRIDTLTLTLPET